MNAETVIQNGLKLLKPMKKCVLFMDFLFDDAFCIDLLCFKIDF